MRWLKTTVFSLLAVAVLTSNLGASLIQLNYAVNLDLIIEQFCVNKDKPIMQCNGQCHLAKQLKQHEEKRQDSQSNEQEEILVLQWFQKVERTAFSKAAITLIQYGGSKFPIEAGFLSLPDHPPSNR